MGVRIFYSCVIFVLACVPLLHFILSSDDSTVQHKLINGGKTDGISSLHPSPKESSVISPMKKDNPAAHYNSSTTDVASPVAKEMDLPNMQLSDLINLKTYELKVNVSDVINFAMIGSPKTGTTSMKEWIRKHPDVLCPASEMHEMAKVAGPGRSLEIMADLIQQKTPSKKLGYKCPAEMYEISALTHLRDYFPSTKLIVGIRHPVLWFQSFYNFRVAANLVKGKPPLPFPPLKLRGKCTEQSRRVCTYNAYFHILLAQMGRTAMSTQEETNLLRRYDVDTLQAMPFEPFPILVPHLPHQIFLYDPDQMNGAKFPDVAEQFRQDLSVYLELRTPLSSLAVAQANTHAERENATVAAALMDICDSKFKPLREELILIGRDAARWITEFFLPLENVHVSSPDFFRRTLEGYEVDPCEVNP
mmetsp:Transcript_19705/g.37347  ORF Transcript_19705/g.37347 Transcript_19705/m.37347 type:complete len:418 (-) Transcript_19705:118-1371(-)